MKVGEFVNIVPLGTTIKVKNAEYGDRMLCAVEKIPAYLYDCEISVIRVTNEKFFRGRDYGLSKTDPWIEIQV